MDGGRATGPEKKNPFWNGTFFKARSTETATITSWEERLEIIEVIEATSEVNRTASCRENGKEFAFEYIG
jgi:hypothetical protein